MQDQTDYSAYLEQLQTYVVQQRAQGVSDEALRAALLAQNWSPQVVDAVLQPTAAPAAMNSQTAAYSPQLQAEYQAQPTAAVAAESPEPADEGFIQGMFGRRIGRLGLLLGSLYFLAVIAVLGLIAGVFQVIDVDVVSQLGFLLMVLIIVVCYLVYLPIAISLTVRRLHDLGKTGWLVLLGLVPVANLGLAIYTLFFPGEPGANQYGDPVHDNRLAVVLGFKAPRS